jgi:hypothetical protein
VVTSRLRDLPGRETLVELEAQPTTRPMEVPVIYEDDDFRLRLAVEEDQASLGQLLASVPFGACTPIYEGRGEDFFALRKLQTSQFGEPPMTFVVENRDGRVTGSISVAVRPARISSQSLNIGEIGDVRFDPSVRGGAVFPIALKRALEHVSNWYGAEVFRTSVLGGDLQALSPWLRRDEARYEQPMGQVMSQMEVVWLPLNVRRIPQPTNHVQRASEIDRDELVAFLLKSESTRRMGADLSAGQLSRRFATWTTFSIENFQLVRGVGGQIIGCGAPWDPGALRTFRLGRPRFGAKLARTRFDLRARINGHGALPGPDTDLAPLVVTHMEVVDDDPATLRDLLIGILRDLDATHQQGLVFAIPKTTAFDRALSGFPTYRLPLSLLAITPAGTPWNNVDFRARRVGFELVFL